MTQSEDRDLTYKVKCRSCGKITEMWFSKQSQTQPRDFVKWAHEHSTFPISKQCDCDNGSILFHDLISYVITF